MANDSLFVQPVDYIAYLNTMISENGVEKLASLARLELDPSMKPVITGQLNSILEYVQCLNQVDTSSINPMSHTLQATNVMREDLVCAAGSDPVAQPLGDPSIPKQGMLTAEDLLRNTPDHSGTFVRAPLIVE
ncbi:MAG: Asp-tRNA(Asn)/Glu-tRNA(Gln) amidotransferase subunit GatC [Pseudomonadota bacterium]